MFKSKTNIILLIILIILLSTGGIICYKAINKPVVAIDYSNMSINEATAWFAENKVEEYLVIENEYSNDIEKDKLIFQSIKPEAKIADKVTLIFSLGPEHPKEKIPVENLKTLNEAKSYFENNGFTNIEYVEEIKADVENNIVISIEPIECYKTDKITVKIAKNEESHKEANSSGIYLPTDLLGISESEFLSKCRELNLTNIVKDETGFYSNKIAKDKLAYYLPDGNVEANTKIVYKLSLGSYEFNEDDFNGKTLEEAENKIKFLNNMNAYIDKNIVTYNIETSKYTEGKLFECEASKDSGLTKIACNIATGTKDNITVNLPTNLLGKTEQEFKNKCSELGLTNIVKDDSGYYSSINPKGTIAYYEPDGKIQTDTKVVYRLSLGPYEFDNSIFKGLTKSDAENKAKELNERNAKIDISFNGTGKNISDCTASKSGSTTKISCSLTNNTAPTISNKATLPTNLLGYKEEDFIAKAKELGFTNLEKDSSGYYSTINAKGTIAYYDPDGELDKNTKIIYKISLGNYEFNASEYNGKTKADVQNYINQLNLLNAHVTLNTNDVLSNEYQSGILFDCSAKKDGINTTVNCNNSVFAEEKTATILSADKLISYYSTSSFDDTSNKIKSYFNDGGFTDVEIIGTKSTKTVGQILSVSVEGNKNYSQGKYVITAKILVEISNELIN